MTLSKLKKRRTVYLTLGIAFWIGFLYCIPSRLSFPWNALSLLLGLFSPLFWYKALDLHRVVAHGGAGESVNSPGARNRTAMRVVYLALGAVSWGIFVYNIPPFAYRIPLPPNDLYQPLVPSDVLPVFRGILGFWAPFLLFAAAYLNIGNDSVWRNFVGSDSPAREREPKPKKARNRIAWASIFLAWLVWVIFLSYIPCDLYGFWALHYTGAGSVSPFLFLCALYLSIKYEHESRAACCSEKTGT